MNNKGLETKEIENQPRLRNFNLNIIFTCNKYTKNIFTSRLTILNTALKQIDIYLKNENNIEKFHHHIILPRWAIISLNKLYKIQFNIYID